MYEDQKTIDLSKLTPPPLPPPLPLSSGPFLPEETNNADSADIDNDETGEHPFPDDCLPEVVRSIVKDVSRAHLAPNTLVAACALGTVSAALGAGLELETEGGQSVRGNLFIGAIAPSGVGKGVASNVITAPFRKFERDLIENWKMQVMPGSTARAEVLEEEIRALKKGIGAKQREPNSEDVTKEVTRLRRELEQVKKNLVPPCLITADATKEALAGLLAAGKNEALASISSEARAVLDVLCGRYNSMTDESIYISAWSGEPIPIHRKGSPPVHLHRPCLSVLWLFQPDKLEMLLGNNSMTASGFLPRFLIFNTWAQPQRETGDRLPIDLALNQKWEALITDLAKNFQQADKPILINTDPEIKMLFRDYKNEIIDRRQSHGDLADVTEYASRWCENAWRIALVLHAAEHGGGTLNNIVSQKTANHAITLMKWFADQQLQILTAGRAKKKAERLFALRDVLDRQPDHSCTLRDMKRRHAFEKSEITNLAREYPDKLKIEKVPSAGPGQPSTIIRLIG